ncbi:hypothetical protein [Kitasatospora sp. NPDC089509]|uniref:hypothetical protein n=1 Tax=Kitasatospora sp. NPDC089509 TaxID=3364079 RepID=UPI00381E08D6
MTSTTREDPARSPLERPELPLSRVEFASDGRHGRGLRPSVVPVDRYPHRYAEELAS